MYIIVYIYLFFTFERKGFLCRFLYPRISYTKVLEFSNMHKQKKYNFMYFLHLFFDNLDKRSVSDLWWRRGRWAQVELEGILKGEVVGDDGGGWWFSSVSTSELDTLGRLQVWLFIIIIQYYFLSISQRLDYLAVVRPIVLKLRRLE